MDTLYHFVNYIIQKIISRLHIIMPNTQQVAVVSPAVTAPAVLQHAGCVLAVVHAAPTLPHSQTPALHTFAFVPHATPPQRHDPETHVNPVVQVTLAQASGKHIGSKLISPALLSHSYSLIISKTNIHTRGCCCCCCCCHSRSCGCGIYK